MAVAAARIGWPTCTVAVPTCASPLVFILRFRVQQPGRLATTRIAGATVNAARHHDHQGHRRRVTSEFEVGQPGQPQGQHGAGDGQPEPRMAWTHAVGSRVIGGLRDPRRSGGPRDSGAEREYRSRSRRRSPAWSSGRDRGDRESAQPEVADHRDQALGRRPSRCPMARDGSTVLTDR